MLHTKFKVPEPYSSGEEDFKYIVTASGYWLLFFSNSLIMIIIFVFIA